MKKRLIVGILVICILGILAGCGCQHEWQTANCTAPKTCVLCNETQGEALGHTWEAATCLVPEQCSTCHEVKGEALGHDWEEATTEAPKTCKSCQSTEGSKLSTDPRFTTASTKEFQGKWSCEVVLTGDMLGTAGYIDEVPATLYYDFGNTGDLVATVEIHDRLAFMEDVKEMTRKILLESFAQAGISENQADQAMLDTYDMTMDEYLDTYIDAIDMDDFFGAMEYECVYYVGNNGIYMAASWYDEFECSAYTLENGVLIMEEDTLEEGGEPLQWTRVEE